MHTTCFEKITILHETKLIWNSFLWRYVYGIHHSYAEPYHFINWLHFKTIYQKSISLDLVFILSRIKFKNIYIYLSNFISTDNFHHVDRKINEAQNKTEEQIMLWPIFHNLPSNIFHSRIKLHVYMLWPPFRLSVPIYGPFGFRHQLFYDKMWCYLQVKD